MQDICQLLTERDTSSNDGIDRDQDEFWLLMNPAVMVVTQGDTTQWTVGFKGTSARIAPIKVSQLKNPASIPVNVKPWFSKLTATDFAQILAQDPLATGGTISGSKRYIQTTHSYGYFPTDGDCGWPGISIANELEDDATHSYETDITEGFDIEMGVGGSVPLTDATLKLQLKDSQSWTFTQKVSSTVTTGSTQSATLTIPCASTNYAGKTQLDIYWDTLYRTFAFMLVDPPQVVIHHGHILDSSGKPAKRQPVALAYGGRTYHTSTDAKGNYRFAAPKQAIAGGVPPSGQLLIGSVRKSVQLGANTPAAEVQIPVSAVR